MVHHPLILYGTVYVPEVTEGLTLKLLKLLRSARTAPVSETPEGLALKLLKSLTNLRRTRVSDMPIERRFPGYHRNSEGKLVDADGFPRRNKTFEWRSGEKAIQDAVDVVEAMGADVRLTQAVVLLAQARDLVADYVEERPEDGIGYR